MSKLIKRADGSYSKRGLWDNIRANKGSGKKPTKQMLEQERKIKKEENMKMEYKKGGKKSIAKEAKREKESFMQESKEIKFGAPSKKFEDGGQKPGDPLKATADSSAYFSNQRQAEFKTQADLVKNSKPGSSLDSIFKSTPFQESRKREETARNNQARQANKGKTGYDKDGNPKPQLKGIYPNQKNAAEEALKLKKGGKKTMEPGGGGRFAKMVNKMKGEGKSEESAKAIAASIGRKKYGKSKFQAMAAAGKKKMGGKKC
jgi:hypothetical protein